MRHLRPGIRIARHPFDLEPLQTGERIAEPSAEFLSIPDNGDEGQITLRSPPEQTARSERTMMIFLGHANSRGSLTTD